MLRTLETKQLAPALLVSLILQIGSATMGLHTIAATRQRTVSTVILEVPGRYNAQTQSKSLFLLT